MPTKRRRGTTIYVGQGRNNREVMVPDPVELDEFDALKTVQKAGYSTGRFVIALDAVVVSPFAGDRIRLGVSMGFEEKGELEHLEPELARVLASRLRGWMERGYRPETPRRDEVREANARSGLVRVALGEVAA